MIGNIYKAREFNSYIKITEIVNNRIFFKYFEKYQTHNTYDIDITSFNELFEYYKPYNSKLWKTLNGN